MQTWEVLLVDDEAPALHGLVTGVHWSALGIEQVHTASSMEQALEILSAHTVHLMISDIEMPGGSGLRLIECAKERYPALISVFYTAHPSFSYCQEALKLGAVDYMVKPTPYEEIEAVVIRALGIAAQHCHTQDLEHIWGQMVAKEPTDDPISQVQALIEERLGSEISRDELAAAVYLSPDYLTRRFRQETGMSLSDYILEKRLALARNLLCKSQLSVGEIAEKAGFSYPSYFVRLFRKKMGITPQQYRQQHAQP